MTTTNLYETVSITLSASGGGTAKIGPLSAREVWHPTQVSVMCSSAVNEAVCRIYVGDAADQRNFRDGTFSGSSGDSSDNVAVQVKSGHYVFAVWTGGDARATATMTVIGTREI